MYRKMDELNIVSQQLINMKETLERRKQELKQEPAPKGGADFNSKLNIIWKTVFEGDEKRRKKDFEEKL